MMTFESITEEVMRGIAHSLPFSGTQAFFAYFCADTRRRRRVTKRDCQAVGAFARRARHRHIATTCPLAPDELIIGDTVLIKRSQRPMRH